MDRIRIDIIPTSSSIDFQGYFLESQADLLLLLLSELPLSHQILISMSACVCVVYLSTISPALLLSKVLLNKNQGTDSFDVLIHLFSAAR